MTSTDDTNKALADAAKLKQDIRASAENAHKSWADFKEEYTGALAKVMKRAESEPLSSRDRINMVRASFTPSVRNPGAGREA